MEVVAAVRSLAAQISSAQENAVPRLLLRLKDTIQRSRLDSPDLRESAYHLLWQKDIVHVLVGVTRRDFSRMPCGWETAAQLAELLATVCSGLKPQKSRLKKKKKKTKDVEKSNDDQIEDFYKKLLPSAVDSLLILANSLLDHTLASKQRIRPNSPALHVFQSLLISLSRLSSSHSECLFRVIQSPLLPDIIASNQPQFCLSVVTTLNNLNVGQHTLPSALHTHHHNILEVLAYKITYSESKNELMTECLKLLAALIDPNSSEEIVPKLCSKYPTLASSAVRVEVSGLGSRVEQLVRWLEKQLSPLTPPPPLSHSLTPPPPPPPPRPSAGVDSKRKDAAVITQSGSPPQDQNTDSGPPSLSQSVRSDREPYTRAGCERVSHSAASVIQSSWRRHRQRLRMAEEARCHHQREMEDVGWTEFDGVVSYENDEDIRKQLKSFSEMRMFHEKQMSLLEKVPATQVVSFLHGQRTNAATVIQAWWRGTLGRKQFRSRKGRARMVASAGVIQRAVRRFLRERRRKQEPLQPGGSRCVCFLEENERDVLQAEIVKYRDKNPPPTYSETQLRQVHSEVQQLLRDFYTRNSTVKTAQEDRERKDAFLARLEHDCNLLLGAPRLSEAEEDVCEQFSTGSKAVLTMAHQLHREEVRVTELPWWKRPFMTSNEELLKLQD